MSRKYHKRVNQQGSERINQHYITDKELKRRFGAKPTSNTQSMVTVVADVYRTVGTKP